MAAKQPSSGPAVPRVAHDLDDRPEPLADGVSWNGVAADVQATFSGSASECEIIGSSLVGVRLTGAPLDDSRFVDVVLDDCELSGTTLQGSTLVRVVFRRCRMSSLIAHGLKAEDVRFVDCKLDDANFRGARFERFAFDDCDLAGADFYGATLVAGRLCGSRLTGVEFSKATCDGLDLRGSIVDGVKGAGSLRASVIGTDQMVPLGIALLTSLEIRVDDGEPEDL